LEKKLKEIFKLRQELLEANSKVSSLQMEASSEEANSGRN